MENLERIKKVMKTTLGNADFIDGLSADSLLVDLGINSVVFIKIVVEMENEFDIEFDDDELDFARIEKLQDLVDVVAEKLD